MSEPTPEPVPLEISFVVQISPIVNLNGTGYTGDLAVYADQLAHYFGDQLSRFALSRGDADLFLRLTVKRGDEAAGGELRTGHYIKPPATEQPNPPAEPDAATEPADPLLNRLPAPWTPEQVKQLNRYQRSGLMHPFTCGRHSFYQLYAQTDGWRCPGAGCDYTQEWAHGFMADKATLDMMQADRDGLLGVTDA